VTFNGKAAVVIETGGPRRGIQSVSACQMADLCRSPERQQSSVASSYTTSSGFHVAEGKGNPARARAARSPRRARGRYPCWRTRRAAYSRWRVALLWREPAQPSDPVLSSAGLLIEPLTYLTALQKGLQPNTSWRDQDITLPPIQSQQAQRGLLVSQELRQQLLRHHYASIGARDSRNLATVGLLGGGIASNAPASPTRYAHLP